VNNIPVTARLATRKRPTVFAFPMIVGRRGS